MRINAVPVRRFFAVAHGHEPDHEKRAEGQPGGDRHCSQQRGGLFAEEQQRQPNSGAERAVDPEIFIQRLASAQVPSA